MKVISKFLGLEMKITIEEISEHKERKEYFKVGEETDMRKNNK